MTERLLSEIVSINPSAFDTWHRCGRLFRNRYLLGVPPSDSGPSSDVGNVVHALLRLVHETGSCRDQQHVGTVLENHDLEAESAVAGYIERHARRCPAPAEHARHEYEVARFHRSPAPMFMATGRLDAVWLHDRVLDVRDYKTGRPPVLDRVEADPRARLQAWLLGARAQRRGLRLRIRYEYLAAEVDEDPEPFEPDDDDLAAIEEELRACVAAIWDERDFAGVHDASVCGWCEYRSICPDSATPAEPVWPAPPEEVLGTTG